MTRAAVYIRLSRYRGTDDPSNSPETQRRACLDYAKSQGWDVLDFYTDLDFSGGTTKRPQLAELRKNWRRYDVALAMKLDRWSRSVIDFHELHREASANGVALVAVRDQIDMSSANGRLFATILSAFAEFEREVIRERTLAGKVTQRALGKWNGGKLPFGFKVVDSKLEVNEEQAAIIREILQRRTNNESWLTVCRWLQTVTDNRSWDARTVRRVLQQPRLNGTILSPGEWELAQKLAEAQSRSDWTPRQDHLLSGLLRCDTCDATCSYFKGHRGRATYRCNRNRCDRRGMVYADEIEQHITSAFLNAYASNPEYRRIVEADERAEQIAELKGQLQAIDATLSALEPDALIAAAQQKRKLLEALETLQKATTAAVRFQQTGKTLGQVWEGGDLEQKRQLLQAHLGEIRVTGTGSSVMTSGKIHLAQDERTPEQILGIGE